MTWKRCDQCGGVFDAEKDSIILCERCISNNIQDLIDRTGESKEEEEEGDMEWDTFGFDEDHPGVAGAEYDG